MKIQKASTAFNKVIVCFFLAVVYLTISCSKRTV